MTDTQLLHKANGILRIRECIKSTEMLPTECGTIYGSCNLRKQSTFMTTIAIPKGFEKLWSKPNPPIQTY